MKYIKKRKFSIKGHSSVNEKMIQKEIEADPSILGLGDLRVIDSERRQPSGGILDILLEKEDGDSTTRYEVELQLGSTDASHIIRTIEYWDNERKRYTEYTHIAVIIAEDITGRFFNVISLFNGHIPIIAIQMNALKLNDNEYTLSFTKVLGQFGADEETKKATRDDWKSYATVELADKLLEYINEEFGESYELHYTKAYIGLAKGGDQNSFARFSPQRRVILLRLRLEKSEETDTFLEDKFPKWSYRDNWEKYRLKLSPSEITDKKDDLLYILRKAYDARNR